MVSANFSVVSSAYFSIAFHHYQVFQPSANAIYGSNNWNPLLSPSGLYQVRWWWAQKSLINAVEAVKGSLKKQHYSMSCQSAPIFIIINFS